MCKAMIISVGGTTAPIIKSITYYKPDFISFLASQETSDKIPEIKAEAHKAGAVFKNELTLVDDPNNLFHCHEKADEAVRRVLNKKYVKGSVIVDYTGGTKNMSVALSLSAITHGFSFSYVGGTERTKDGVGIVVDGKEKIHQSINPWEFLAVEERKKIALLFNQFQFKAARELVASLFAKGTRNKSLYKRLGSAIEGYQKWDLFRHSDAQIHFERAKLDEMMTDEDMHFRSFAAETEKTRVFLEKLLQNSNNGKHPCVEFMCDLFANAERRFQEGKVDDAVLRIYRIVELGAQDRLLKKHGISASDVRPAQLPESIKDRFIKQYKNSRNGHIEIPQNAAYELLGALGDELAELYQKNKSSFLDIQSSRNNSYLAHGFVPAKESTYERLRGFILSLGLFKLEETPSFPTMIL